MYPELGFDIKNRKPSTILNKIMRDKYKSEIPQYINKFMENKLFKNRKYHSSINFLPTTRSKPDDNDPFNKQVASKTTETKSSSSKKKKIYTSIDNINNSERVKLLSSILGNDVVDVVTNQPTYEKIILEIIHESDMNLNATDNELIHNYLKKINIDKDISRIDDISRLF